MREVVIALLVTTGCLSLPPAGGGAGASDAAPDATVLEPGRCPPGYTRRVQLTFDNTFAAVEEGDAELRDFPVVLHLEGALAADLGLRADLADLRVGDDDGALLTVEPETDGAGPGHGWVRVPRIDAASATDHVWLFGGSPAAEPVSEPGRDVWRDDYLAVWHFAGSTGSFPDSTGHGHDAVATVSDGVTAVDGMVGGAVGLGGSDGLEVMASQALGVTGSLTLEALIRFDQLVAGDRQLVLDGDVFQLIGAGGMEPAASFILRFADATQRSVGQVVGPGPGTWYYLVAVLDRGDDTMRLALDGVVAAKATVPAGPLVDAVAGLAIGDGVKGALDEVRISAAVRGERFQLASLRAFAGTLGSFGPVDDCP